MSERVLDVINEIKKDTTDVKVTYMAESNTVAFSRPFIVLALNETNDYMCYLKLINWRVPIES
jgi:hypothetical protein